MERTLLVDPTEEVFGAHIDQIANGTVAVVSAADFRKTYPETYSRQTDRRSPPVLH